MAYRRNYFTGGQVTSPQISPEAVTEDKIADNAITSSKIKDGEVKSVDIGDGQVRTEDLADGAVTLAKLGGDVSVIPLMDGSVTNTKLASNAVSADKIANGAVTSDKIAAGAVTSLKIPDGSITNAKIATNTITQGKIANNAIGTGEIQNGAVTAENLAPGVGGGDRITFLPMSLEAVYLAGQSGSIDWTTADLSAWIPAGAKAAIIQLGMFTESLTPPARAEARFRANEEQRESIGITNKGSNQMDLNFGIVPITPARTLDYNLTVNGTITVTFWVTIIGYVI